MMKSRSIVAEGVDNLKMDVDDCDECLLTMKETTLDLFAHESMNHPSSTFPNAVRRLGTGCIPCRRPCNGIKLLELIDHRRLGCYGLCRRTHALNTVEGNGETLIEYVEDEQL